MNENQPYQLEFGGLVVIVLIFALVIWALATSSGPPPEPYVPLMGH